MVPENLASNAKMHSDKYIRFFILLASVCYVAAEVHTASEEIELKNNRNCNALCQHCGCKGFYCGEECICECSSTDEQDTQCLQTMQSNCKKLNIPFEVLIQGPIENKFVQTAKMMEEVYLDNELQEMRAKRSTGSIYRPGPIPPLINSIANLIKGKIAEKAAAKNANTNAPVKEVVETKPAPPTNTFKTHKRRGTNPLFEDNDRVVAPAPWPTTKARDLLPSASEDQPRGFFLPNGLKSVQVENAIAKVKEAIENLNAKTEQLLAASTIPGWKTPNFLNLGASVPFPDQEAASDNNYIETRPPQQPWKSLFNLGVNL